MAFGDEDLKQLKEFLAHDCKTCEDHRPLMPFTGSPFDRTKALLARLEAAEMVCRAGQELIDSAALYIGYKRNPGDPPAVMHLKNIDLAIESWHKASGK